MLNQSSYGKMEISQEIKKGGPYSVPCSKCKSVFLLEKTHKELYSQDMFWGRQADGTLAPATPKNVEYIRLCQACFNQFKVWLG